MSSRAALRVTAALAAALAAVVGAGPAHAVPPPEIPADVAAAFAGDGLRKTQAAAEGLDADFSGAIRADDIHEVFVFTPEFVVGGPTSEPVISNDTWMASIKRGDDVLGVLWVSKWPGEPAQWTGASPDVALATALGTVSATEILIDDAPSGSYYALAGTTVRPLNDWARDALRAPAELSDFQETVAEQYALRTAQSANAATDERWRMIGGSVGVVAVLAVFGGIALLARRRRPARDHGAGTTA